MQVPPRNRDVIDHGRPVVFAMGVQHHVTALLRKWLRSQRASGVPIVAICSGAYILSKAGLPDTGRTAVQRQYVNLTRSVFVAACGGAAVAEQV